MYTICFIWKIEIISVISNFQLLFSGTMRGPYILNYARTHIEDANQIKTNNIFQLQIDNVLIQSRILTD